MKKKNFENAENATIISDEMQVQTIEKDSEFEDLRQLVIILSEENKQLKENKLTAKKVIELKEIFTRNATHAGSYAAKAYEFQKALENLQGRPEDEDTEKYNIVIYEGSSRVISKITTNKMLVKVIEMMYDTSVTRLQELEEENNQLLSILGEI